VEGGVRRHCEVEHRDQDGEPRQDGEEDAAARIEPGDEPPGDHASTARPFQAPESTSPPPPHPAPLPLELNPTPPPRPWFRKPWGAGALVLSGVAALLLILAGLRTRNAWTLDVATSPPSADLMVDGRYQGQTPMRTTLSKGQNHLVRVERQGYVPITREVRQNEWSLHFILKRTPYPISVITDPPGAEVFLDGESVGITPIRSLPVPMEGTHELRIRKKGYQEWHALLEKDMPFPATVRLSPGR